MQQDNIDIKAVKLALDLDKVKNIDLENEAALSEEAACIFCVPLIVATIIGC